MTVHTIWPLLGTMCLALFAALPATAQDAQGTAPTTTAEEKADARWQQIRVLFENLDDRVRVLADQLESLETRLDDQGTVPEAMVNGSGAAGIAERADELATEVQKRRDLYRFIQIIGILVLGMVSLYIVLHFTLRADQARREKNPEVSGLTPQDVLNVSGLSLIIFGTILVVMVADAEVQLTAAVGILGALAGYLFRGLHDKPEKGDTTASGAGSGSS